MGRFTVIRPKDDGPAQQASGWCDDLIHKYRLQLHTKVRDVDDLSPADGPNIDAALRVAADLICYFGHGSTSAWLTAGSTTIDSSLISAVSGKAVVSVACETGRNLGPDAVTAGAVAWLGFTIKVPVMAPHKLRDPFGEAIVEGLTKLGYGDSLQDARDAISANCKNLVTDFATGTLAAHPAAGLGYYAALALSEHIVVHGQVGFRPL